MALLVLWREKTLKTVYIIDQLSFKFTPFANCCELKLCSETTPCEGMREIWSDFQVKPSTDFQHPPGVRITLNWIIREWNCFIALTWTRQWKIGLLPKKHMAFINQCSKLLSGVTWLSLVDYCTSSDEVSMNGARNSLTNTRGRCRLI